MGTPKKLVVLATALAAAALLAGCSSNATAQSPATKTVTAAPAPSASTPTSSATTGTSTAPSTPGATAVPAVDACTTAQLNGRIIPGSGGAAGSVYVNLELANKSKTPCTLQGWPGVSFVGKGDGSQIGAPATFNRATQHTTKTLAPSGTVTAELKIVQAGNYPAAECGLTKADGFRVYPPGQKASLFVSYPSDACSGTGVSLLEVSGLK